MKKRTSFPNVFWVSNFLELVERFAYYGIYMGFGIYVVEHLGFSTGQLGAIQSIFLAISYTVPVISGTFADRYGFKKVLIVAYLAYIPSIFLLLFTKSFSGIALTMLSIGFAAGIFKPLIAGTVRSVTDGSNKTLGFGIFYAMVNVGASFGPIIMGKLRIISWNYAYIAAAISITIGLIVTIIFYKEPERTVTNTTLGDKLKEIGLVLSDKKFTLFLILLGLFFWLPFWAFFNLCALYIDNNLDTVQLYLNIKSVLGTHVANFLSKVGEDGNRELLGETIAHTGYIIILFQVMVSKTAEKFDGMNTFLTGLFITGIGLILIGIAKVSFPAIAILGIMVVAVGEMTASPRIQEYITWIAPKEKAGLYMGTNFLSIAIGAALSGVVYTTLFGYFNGINHPEYVWYVLSLNMILGIGAIKIFTKTMGEFKELG